MTIVLRVHAERTEEWEQLADGIRRYKIRLRGSSVGTGVIGDRKLSTTLVRPVAQRVRSWLLNLEYSYVTTAESRVTGVDAASAVAEMQVREFDRAAFDDSP